MSSITGAEIIVDSLLKHQVDTLFVMPGEQLDPLFKVLSSKKTQLKVIHIRHEQAAAYMAYGYARSTGKPGVLMVPPGPGLLNACAGLATAYAGNVPVLCFTGQVPSKAIGKGYGHLHELPDQLGIMEKLSKWAIRIEQVAQINQTVAHAFLKLRESRQRPVIIEMAPDLLMCNTLDSYPYEDMRPKHIILDENQLQIAAKILIEANKPLIMVGGGAYHAGIPLKKLAEIIQAPVISNCSGKGILSDRHYLSHSWPVGHRLWQDADVVLAVGTRLFQPRMLWGVDQYLQIIHIDVDQEELSRQQDHAIKILGDAELSLQFLVQEIEKKQLRVKSIKDEMLSLKLEFQKQFSEVQPQFDYLQVIREELADDGFFVDELTQVGYVSRFAFPVYQERTYIPATYQGTLGFGFASALGVKIGNPNKPVISISGDGGFLYTAAELATAVQFQIAIVAIVFNDNAFGNVKRKQKEENYVLGVDLHNPDFVKLAESFGAQGIKVHDLEEFQKTLRFSLQSNTPTVIEVPVTEMANPWHYIRLPKVRGVSNA